MSLNTIMSTATTGLLTAQIGLRTVSDNIANANTPGYVRKIVDQVSLSAQGMGVGVDAAAVRRVTDSYLQTASLNASSSAGRSGAIAEFLDTAQGLFGDPTGDASFFTRYDDALSAFSAAAEDPAVADAYRLAEAAARRLSGPGLRFEPNPVRMDQALAGADLVVCHGGQGTLAAAALAGKPVLVLPTQLEQAMAARRVQACGWGLAVEPAGPPPTLAPVLLRLLREPGFAQAAQVVAQRHAGATPAATAQRVADLVSAGLGA